MRLSAVPADTLVGIPPELDRALARAVLDDVRYPPPTAGLAPDGAGGDGPAADPLGLDAPLPDAPAALTQLVTRVVDALDAQGARASEVLLAIEDAFAALLAGQGDPARRARVRALDAHARSLVAARLGYGR